MAFDLAIGLHRAQLDEISASLYKQVYPQLFTGSEQQEYSGVEYTVAWDIQTPATFDLSDPGAARTALAAHLASQPGAAEHPRELLQLAAASTAAFSFTYQTVKITLSAPGVSSAEFTLTLTAQAKVLAQANGSQTIDVYAISAPKLENPVENVLVQTVVLPRILASAQTIFGGVGIPPLKLGSLPLSAPIPFVDDEILIAIANLAQSGAPPVPAPGSFPWPPSPFFALLGNAAMQAQTAQQVSSDSHSASGSNGSSWFGDEWSYSMNVTDPQVTIDGNALAFRANIEGSVSASVNVFHIPIGVGFTAYAAPPPSGELSLEPSGDSIVVRTKEMQPFTLLVVPSGSIPEKITAAMLEVIVAAVVASATPFFTRLLEGIEFGSMEIPSYPVKVGEVTVTATPTGIVVGNCAGMIALEGNLTIST